ncbi:MAG: hypothetical protein HY953_08695, partial [Candidatus Rokubacteria bacterium]|nr:hypothetical protein [Candidatus Rokubacteria bacterium]
MRIRRTLTLALAALTVFLLGPLATGAASALEKPRYGGELVFVVPSEPPSYD